MRTIIRIEHSSGYGIYRATDKVGNDIVKIDDPIFKELITRHYDFPTPILDVGLRFINSSEFCAFKSVEQLQQWITKEEIQELSKLDFKVLMLDVSAYREGKYQILYQKKDIIQSKDITNLFI